MTDFYDRLLALCKEWSASERHVASLVLFGSHARNRSSNDGPDQWSDIDLHMIASRQSSLITAGLIGALPLGQPLMQLSRSTQGGAVKYTVIYREISIDLVVVSLFQARMARAILHSGLYRKFPRAKVGLLKLSTILKGGFLFLKGERSWKSFYVTVSKLPGVRLADDDAMALANSSIAEILGIRNKVKRGELIAAQRSVHQIVFETNAILLHELRLRAGNRSFEQARRLEMLLPPQELSWVEVDARLQIQDLMRATDKLFVGLIYIMNELVPSWKPPEDLVARIKRVGVATSPDGNIIGF